MNALDEILSSQPKQPNIWIIIPKTNLYYGDIQEYVDNIVENIFFIYVYNEVCFISAMYNL